MSNINEALKQKLAQLEDEIWFIIQNSRALQEHRKDIRGLWNDSASKDLNMRYLNPHEQDDAAMLKELDNQQTSLQQVFDNTLAIFEKCRVVNEQSDQILIESDDIKNDLALANENIDRAIDRGSDSKALLPEVYDLIERANNSGDRSPSRASYS